MSKERSLFVRIIGYFALCGVLLAAGPALSQAAGADQNAGAAQNGTTSAAATADQDQAAQAAQGGLQEVVVTAERRAENLQATPIVISAISGDQLQAEHVTNFTDLQVVAPSFVDSESGGGFTEALNIRGIGTTATGDPQILPGIATYHDGMLQGEVTGLDVPFYDIADVEVLEGPQGTLGGTSSVGGTVLVNSANPNFRGLNGYIDTQIGSFTDKRVDGAVNLTATDTLAFRVAFNEEAKNSYYRDVGAYDVLDSGRPLVDPGSLTVVSVRLGVLWKPTDNFQALGKYEYNLLNEGGEAAEPNPVPYTSLFNGASCSATGPNGSIICPGAGVSQFTPFYYPTEQPLTLDYNSTQDEYIDRIWQPTLELRYTLPGGTVLRSMSGFLYDDTDLIFPQSYGPLNDGINYHELGPCNCVMNQEIDAISPTTGKLNWIAGAFWYDRISPINVATQVFAPPYSAAEVPTSVSESAVTDVVRAASLFGNVNWQFTPTWQLQLGLRENWDNNYNATDPGAGVYKYPNFPPNQLPGTPVVPYDVCPPLGGSLLSCIRNEGHYKDSVLTGKADINWTPVPGQNFYAFFARGYRGGGPNGNQLTVNPTFKPEVISDYELGWKGQLLNDHIITQVGGYWMRYVDMQFPAYNFYTPSTGGSDTVNLTAPSTIKGLEFSMQSKFGPLRFDLSGDYNKSSLGNYSALNNAALPGGTAYNFNSAAAPSQCPASGPIPGCFNYLPYVQSFSGEPNAFSPTWTFNADLSYAFMVGTGTLTPRVTYSYFGSQYAAIFETPFYYIPDHKLLGGDVDYAIGSWLVELYGTNLANVTWIASNTGSLIYYGTPRQIGLRLTYTFGGTGGGAGGN